MDATTLRADAWRRYHRLPICERPAVIADVLTCEENVALAAAGVRPTNDWFAGQAAVDAVEARITRLEGITDVLRKAATGEF